MGSYRHCTHEALFKPALYRSLYLIAPAGPGLIHVSDIVTNCAPRMHTCQAVYSCSSCCNGLQSPELWLPGMALACLGLIAGWHLGSRCQACPRIHSTAASPVPTSQLTQPEIPITSAVQQAPIPLESAARQALDSGHVTDLAAGDVKSTGVEGPVAGGGEHEGMHIDAESLIRGTARRISASVAAASRSLQQRCALLRNARALPGVWLSKDRGGKLAIAQR